MWNLAEAPSQCSLSSLSSTPLPSEGFSGLVVWMCTCDYKREHFLLPLAGRNSTAKATNLKKKVLGPHLDLRIFLSHFIITTLLVADTRHGLKVVIYCRVSASDCPITFHYYCVIILSFHNTQHSLHSWVSWHLCPIRTWERFNNLYNVDVSPHCPLHMYLILPVC